MVVDTWNDVIDLVIGELGGRYHESDSVDDWLAIVRDDATVAIGQFAALDDVYIAITADLFETRTLDATTALEINAALPIGALIVHDARYVLRVTLPLLGLRLDALRDVILHVRRHAAHMRDKHVTRASRPALYEHYVD